MEKDGIVKGVLEIKNLEGDVGCYLSVEVVPGGSIRLSSLKFLGTDKATASEKFAEVLNE